MIWPPPPSGAAARLIEFYHFRASYAALRFADFDCFGDIPLFAFLIRRAGLIWHIGHEAARDSAAAGRRRAAALGTAHMSRPRFSSDASGRC